MFKISVRPILAATLFITVMAASAAESTVLLDPELSNFEVWIGIPHSSVKGLPDGTYQSTRVTAKGTPMGFNDVKKVFSVEVQDNEPVLRISGEIYGALTTLKEYENYHFSTRFKWGEKKWEPRLNALRDNGILYHCTGEHGTFWNVWKSSIEFQVQETDLGDLFLLGGTDAEVRRSSENQKKYDPQGEYAPKNAQSCVEPDAPHGEWNQLDIYVLGDTAVHMANGQILMVVEHMTKGGEPLAKGQIQIQSEGAECFYKDMKIKPINEFPVEIKSKIRLKGE